MAIRMRPAKEDDVTAYLRRLYLRTEQELIREITRKRTSGYVDYAEVAALERVQRTLQSMVDESWDYIPQMIDTIFYQTEKDASGYRNARALTITQTAIAEQLANNLLGEIAEAAETAKKAAQGYFTVARLEADPLREETLKQTLRKEASGSPWIKSSKQLAAELQAKGITGFVDKSGRKWSMSTYCNMATRTTARQAQVAALLTADTHDLWQIVKIGSTCPLCAALEGRVYSKSGSNPEYPPLSLAFGKIDPAGGNELTNTYLNIHPNCLHSLTKYTTLGKTEEQIQRDKDFSNLEKNPLTTDPRSKKQIQAYQNKVRARQQYLRDKKQHQEYRAALGNAVPKDFAKFQELKYNGGEKWDAKQREYRTIREIDGKEGWSQEFKSRAKETYYQFAKRGVEFSSHGIARFLDRSKTGQYDVDEVVKQAQKKINYIQSDGRNVRFYDSRALVTNPDTGQVVSIINRKKPRSDWNEKH